MSVSAIQPLSPTTLTNASSLKLRPKALTPAGTNNSGSALTGTTTGPTFLNLLVKELQNQDPTAPMDSTAMVGQMISLNQLDQLISINQTLSTATTSTTPGTTSPALSSSSLLAAGASLLNNTSTSTATQAAAAAASDPNSTLNLSSLNTLFGGK